MNQQFSLLPLMPLDPAWIEQGGAFCHPDPRMAKAGWKLLFAAWRGSPAASIPASHSYIAEVTGLPAEVVADRYVVLTDGFEIGDDGRLHHTALTRVCAKMVESYGTEIEAFTTACAMSMQDPEQFSLMSVESGRAGSKLRGKTMLTKGFGFDMYPELRAWCAENAYPAPNQQKLIMEKFVDYAMSRGDKQKDWPATFRTYARKEIEFGRPPAPPVWPDGHPAANAAPVFGARSSQNHFAGLNRNRPSRGEQALDHNRALMAGMRNTPRG